MNTLTTIMHGTWPARMRHALKTFVLASVIAMLNLSAQAQSLQIKGKFGYLGEYELFAVVAPEAPDGNKEFSGPMSVKHVGLCQHSGPNESEGIIRLHFIAATSEVAATLSFDGHECTFRGEMLKTNVGKLVCSGDALPINLWSK